MHRWRRASGAVASGESPLITRWQEDDNNSSALFLLFHLTLREREITAPPVGEKKRKTTINTCRVCWSFHTFRDDWRWQTLRLSQMRNGNCCLGYWWWWRKERNGRMKWATESLRNDQVDGTAPTDLSPSVVGPRWGHLSQLTAIRGSRDLKVIAQAFSFPFLSRSDVASSKETRFHRWLVGVERVTSVNNLRVENKAEQLL